ncbi:MAG TPA: iron-containing alcohol dehydrogenase [Deltaproteobacteria bacterium]|nr:iron-containing alcohol dehydrogenase [Deltaproteobacteria bacterium]
MSIRANPLIDGLCREGLVRAARSLFRAFVDGTDVNAREDMALASLLSGLALANAGLGAVHGLAAVLGGRFTIPHGLICARLLPFVVEANINALKSRAHPSSRAGERYDEVATIITGNPRATAHDGITWICELCSRLNIPSLKGISLHRDEFPAIVHQAAQATSMKGNPVELTREELVEILVKAVS